MGGLLMNSEDVDAIINDQTFILLAVIGLCVLVAVLGVAFAVWLNKFNRELKRVNQRIKNAESEREVQHYLKRRRQLFLSIIPFVKYNKYRK